ncbi:MAG: hypothetical protein IK062_07550 [Selenomonadaceae bacterium]|nr:hypothetical protein [Selenomonadaceae bacterium]
MKSGRNFFLTVFSVVTFCLCFFAEVHAEKKVVAVMPLENVSGYAEYKVAEIMTENLIVEIQNSGSYTVAERTQMGRVLKEQGFQNLTSDSPVEIGEMTGAHYSVVGKVTMAVVANNPSGNVLGNFLNQLNTGGNNLLSSAGNYIHNLKAKVAMDVRFVDNKTGEIVFARTFEGSKSGQNPQATLNAACKVAAQNFLKELQSLNPFAARIAEISGDEIYIDEGSESGLRKGETLIVARESSPIVIKGKIVGMKNNIVGKVKVVEVNSEYSICKVEGGTSSIKKGDIVKRG